ncbi:MAG TPA: hypothetical protein VEI02_07835, partial [Planctomycetota bacterium]|nr:hypothetical protein [Planctomycetota bacterium]
MRTASVVLLPALLLLTQAAPAQDLNANEIADRFAQAVVDDDFATMKSLVVNEKIKLHWAWIELETRYFSAVANKSDKDRNDRYGVLQKFA